MLNRTLTAFGLALTISASPFATAGATELKLFHTWSNESEIGALNVIVKEFESRGNTITEMSVPHEQAGSSPLVSLIVAGTPPNVFINSEPSLYRDLSKRGLGQPLDATFNEIGATPNFPETVLRSITVDGEIRKIPTGVHIDGMIYYNKHVAEQAGVDPTKWTSLDEMFADMEKVQKAGFTFIGMGGNTFQAGYLFHALVAAVAGPDIYNRFYQEKPDETVFDEKGLRDAIDVFRKITNQADPGWVNRQWNETTNTVIAGKTLMQIHGDWMKGQWLANKKVLGEDFACVNIPGTKALSVTVDAFGILGGVPEDQLKAELEFAKIVVDPKINAEFASIKGSSPVRLDVPSDKLDACNQLVLESLKKPGFSVQNPFNISDPDWQNSVWNTMYTFQGDPDMTPDDVIEAFKSEYAAIFP
ncbi:ABC transporter substrate-binding protein [Mesorhizobium sp. IMUNJ 23232]|uniref:ABC transporter substrate-binding protein n=1 Tax=Mesorhizobium sp. IMUNJ 23232 TaxID=3376064 RepID=UPI00378E8349